MRPILLDTDVFGIHIVLYSYATFLILGAMIALIFLPIQWKKAGVPMWMGIKLIALLGIMTIMGARLVYSLIYFQQTLQAPEKIFDLSFTGFTLYGGLLFSFFGLLIVSKRSHLSVLKIMDVSTPVLAVCLVVSRLGCLLNGCCYGKVTQLPWGQLVTKGSLAYKAQLREHPLSLFSGSIHVHPTQIYEMMVVVLALILGILVYKKIVRMDGFLALPFVFLLSLGRLIVFYYRNFPSDTVVGSFVRGPILYGSCMVVSAVWMIHSYKKLEI